MFTSQFQAASFRRKHQYFLKYIHNALPSPLLCFCSTYSHNWHLGALHCWQFPSHFFGVCSAAVVLLRSQCFAYTISWDSLSELSFSENCAILAEQPSERSYRSLGRSAGLDSSSQPGQASFSPHPLLPLLQWHHCPHFAISLKKRTRFALVQLEKNKMLPRKPMQSSHENNS